MGPTADRLNHLLFSRVISHGKKLLSCHVLKHTRLFNVLSPKAISCAYTTYFTSAKLRYIYIYIKIKYANVILG